MMSPMLAVMAGHGHWPLTPTNARVYPSGAALTHPIFQLYVLKIPAGFDVAVALVLPVALVVIDEHAVKADVLEIVDVISVVELKDDNVNTELEDVELEDVTIELEDVELEDVTIELEVVTVDINDEEV